MLSLIPAGILRVQVSLCRMSRMRRVGQRARLGCGVSMRAATDLSNAAMLFRFMESSVSLFARALRFGAGSMDAPCDGGASPAGYARAVEVALGAGSD